jgi:hypothetical protein
VGLHGRELSVVPATSLELAFADGEYSFALHLPQLAELQEKRKTGVFALYGRVMAGRFLAESGEAVGHPQLGEAFAEDIYETIRLALIGGGKGLVDGQEIPVSALTAKRLIETYAHPAPLMESWGLAAAILGAKIVGYVPQKKSPPRADQSPAEQAGKPKRRKASTSEQP